MKTSNFRNFIGIAFLVFFVFLIFIPFSHAQAAYPAPEIRMAQVRSFHKADGSIGTEFIARITGPSPEDVVSFTVTGPTGTFNLVPHKSLRQKGLLYRAQEGSIVSDGSYTFEVTDSLGRSASVDRNFIYNSALPQVDSATMVPQNEAYVDTTTPTLSFDPVPGSVYYQVLVMDYTYKAIWYISSRTQETSFTVPEGLLKPHTPYIWFVRVFDSAGDPQNYHESERLTFYTGARGLPDLGERHVLSFPAGEDIAGWFGVRETNIAPWDINYLMVTGPDSTVYNLDSVDCRFYIPAYYYNKTITTTPIPDGAYTFEIEDDELNYATLTSDYTYNPVPAVSEESRSPEFNAYFNTNRPTFSWAPIVGNGACYYSLRIWDYNGRIKWYQSPPSIETSVTLPEWLNLPWGSSYKWQVMTWDSDTVINNMNYSSLRTFTINSYVEYPTVVSVTPADKTVRVAVDTQIIIQFSKQMDRQSVEDSVKLKDGFENRIPGVFSWSGTVYPDDTVTFTPAQDLAYSMSYMIDINGGCQDAIHHHGLNGYWEGEEHCFATVGAPGDDSSPEVMTVLPYDGQVGGDTHEIGAIISKPLDPATITPDNVILNGPGISGYRVEVDCDPYRIMIIPDAPLAPGSDFTVILTTGLTDTEGHALASAYEWSFNTGAGDTTPPNITQTMPADGVTNTSPWAAIKVYFSENMNPDTINETTVTVYDETVAEYRTIHINKMGVRWDGNRSRFAIWPVFGEEWTVGHTFTVLVSQTVADWAGNPLGADYTFSFTVIDHPDFAPEVWVGNCRGVREADGSTVVELSLWAHGAHESDNITVVATDLTQIGKVWNIANVPGTDCFEYESPGDEGLIVGYHEFNFLVTDTINGQFTNLRWNFYIFNASPSLTSPLDGAQSVSLTPSFSWNTSGVVNDDLYKIDIYDTPYTDDADVVWSTYIIADGGADYTVTLPACRALDPSTTYYWEVFANDTRNWPQGDADSELWSFTTVTAGPPPVPDIKANGLDGPLFVIPSESVDLSISLDPGDMAGVWADWWGILLSSHGNFPLFGFQAPLFELPDTSLFSIPWPVGWYIFLFGLDDVPDGAFELDWYDYVVVISQPAGTQLKNIPNFDGIIKEKMRELIGE
jgi:hypothetical protein